MNSTSDVEINGKIVTCADDTCLLFIETSWNAVCNKAYIKFN